MEVSMLVQKSLLERCFHAILFEVLALLICVPVMSWVLDVSVIHAGVLTLMISLVAMTWNVIFNIVFDRIERHYRWQRTFLVRMLHAVTFEAGLILAVVPLAAWWLEIGLVEAFLLDIGLVLFFLPYTLLYNWCYDKLRTIVVGRMLLS